MSIVITFKSIRNITTLEDFECTCAIESRLQKSKASEQFIINLSNHPLHSSMLFYETTPLKQLLENDSVLLLY